MSAPTTRRWTKDDERRFGKKPVAFRPLQRGFNKFGYFFAHPNYVTPASIVAKLIEERHSIIQARVTPFLESNRSKALHHDEGWVKQLGWEMSQYLNSTEGACVRRLYEIRHGVSKVCKIEYAEAICYAFGMNMEVETDIPTLPGNKKLAADLVEVRAEMHGVTLTRGDLAKYAEIAWRLSGIIVRNPNRLERVQNMAPFDCLRNPR